MEKTRVHSFDLNSIDPELVQEINMKNVPLRAKSVSVVVFNLSIVGTDWLDLVKEGIRVLKDGGVMFIADTKEHLKGYLKNLVPCLEDLGMNILEYNDKRKPFVMIRAYKEF